MLRLRQPKVELLAYSGERVMQDCAAIKDSMLSKGARQILDVLTSLQDHIL
jgi:hypothetical protein